MLKPVLICVLLVALGYVLAMVWPPQRFDFTAQAQTRLLSLISKLNPNEEQQSQTAVAEVADEHNYLTPRDLLRLSGPRTLVLGGFNSLEAAKELAKRLPEHIVGDAAVMFARFKPTRTSETSEVMILLGTFEELSAAERIRTRLADAAFDFRTVYLPVCADPDAVDDQGFVCPPES